MLVHYGSRVNKAAVRGRIMATLSQIISDFGADATEYISLAGFAALDSKTALRVGARHVVAVECDQHRFRRLAVNVQGSPIIAFAGDRGAWARRSGRTQKRRLLWADLEGGFNEDELSQVRQCFETGAIRNGDWLVVTFDRSPRVLKLRRPFRSIIDSAMSRATALIAHHDAPPRGSPDDGALIGSP